MEKKRERNLWLFNIHFLIISEAEHLLHVYGSGSPFNKISRSFCCTLKFEKYWDQNLLPNKVPRWFVSMSNFETHWRQNLHFNKVPWWLSCSVSLQSAVGGRESWSIASEPLLICVCLIFPIQTGYKTVSHFILTYVYLIISELGHFFQFFMSQIFLFWEPAHWTFLLCSKHTKIDFLWAFAVISSPRNVISLVLPMAAYYIHILGQRSLLAKLRYPLPLAPCHSWSHRPPLPYPTPSPILPSPGTPFPFSRGCSCLAPSPLG